MLRPTRGRACQQCDSSGPNFSRIHLPAASRLGPCRLWLQGLDGVFSHIRQLGYRAPRALRPTLKASPRWICGKAVEGRKLHQVGPSVDWPKTEARTGAAGGRGPLEASRHLEVSTYIHTHIHTEYSVHRRLSESLLSAGDFRGPIGNVDELRVPDWGLSETVPGEPHLNRLEP